MQRAQQHHPINQPRMQTANTVPMYHVSCGMAFPRLPRLRLRTGILQSTGCGHSGIIPFSTIGTTARKPVTEHALAHV